jgi:S-adenosylmethionine synthetase
MNDEFVFFSRSVTEGHSDKLCDQISDAIVGGLLRADPFSRVSAECAVSSGIVFLAIRMASAAVLDFSSTARAVIADVGYGKGGDFDPRNCTVMTNVAEFPEQPGARRGEQELQDGDPDLIPALDEATVFGYACRHTPTLMPLPIWLAHRLSRRLDEVRRNGTLPYLAPEGKTQVGVEFRGRVPRRIHSVHIIASQLSLHTPDLEDLRKDLHEVVVKPVFAEETIQPDRATRIDINRGGAIAAGGPSVHSGLTGRKGAEDTYGEYSRNTQIALSGKDPSRVGRTGSYAARYAAKNVVAAQLAGECEVQLSYAMGVPAPISIQVETFGTGKYPDGEVSALLKRHLDFRIAAMIRRLDLRLLPSRHRDGFYRKLATYGHVGRSDIELPWEATDIMEELRSAR